MLAWLKRLLWDESVFERYARAFFLSGGAGLAALALTGHLAPFMTDMATRETWLFVAAAMQGLGGLIGAGDKNPPLGNNS